MHEHEHECQHRNVKYCSKCSLVYCKDCGKEWQEYYTYYHPWTGTYYPPLEYVYNNTSQPKNSEPHNSNIHMFTQTNKVGAILGNDVSTCTHEAT